MTTLKQNPFLLSSILDDFFPTEHSNYPFVNIYEAEKNFIVELQIPGISKDALQIQSEKGLLTIQFDQPTSKENTSNKLIKKEFITKSFKKTFSLDDKINAEAIEASLENGILTLVLPLKENTDVAKKLISIK